MAHSPEVKARAVLMLIEGEKSIREIASECKISHMTVKTWSADLRRKGLKIGDPNGATSNEARRTAFEEKLERFLTKALDAMSSYAELATDHDYIRKQSVDDAIKIFGFLEDRAQRLVRLTLSIQPGGEQPALPQSAEPTTEVVVGELVDDDEVRGVA